MRAMPGLLGNAGELPDRTFEEAARLAAYYSKGRDQASQFVVLEIILAHIHMKTVTANIVERPAGNFGLTKKTKHTRPRKDPSDTFRTFAGFVPSVNFLNRPYYANGREDNGSGYADRN